MPRRHRVAVLAVDGVVGFELGMPCQVFCSAVDPDTGEPLYELLVCGDPGGAGATAHGLDVFRVVPPYRLDAAAGADTVIVPSSETADSQPAEVLAVVRAAHERGARIASICMGVYVLAAAGLLTGRRVAAHWAHAELFASRYPDVEVDADAIYLDDGDVLTSAGVTAGVDLCLHLVRRDHGAAVAASTARRLVMAPHRSGTQAQYVESPAPADNGRLEPTLEWMQAHLAEPLTLAEIAAHASVSTRSLNRRFRAQTGTTPLQWLIRLRLHRAQELLETTELSVGQIATAAGFGTPVLMRQHFARALGVSPQSYRRSFRAVTTGGAVLS
jgi:AraC family transcriptional regulator, transcriptional activator FtrA